MSNIKPIVEFLLWQNCPGHGVCIFCHQQAFKDKSKFLNDDEKIDSLNSVHEFIVKEILPKEDGTPNQYTGNHVLLVGGEIFSIKNELVNKRLIELVDFITDVMIDGHIERLYVNTNLIYSDLRTLQEFLNMIKTKNLFERLSFSTSWDVHGRFDTEEKRALFSFNLNFLKHNYPDLRVVVNTIMTKQFCEAVEEHNLTVKEFQERWNYQMFLIPYMYLTDCLLPTKNQVLDTLMVLDETVPGLLHDHVFNFCLPQPKLLFNYDSVKKDLEFCSSDDSECGHSVNFKKYCSDSDDCYVCTVKNLLDTVIT